MSLGVYRSKEPDYQADSVSLDVAQEVYGNMTTVALGFTRGVDKVLKHNEPTFNDNAKHWQYRLGVTQVLTPRLFGQRQPRGGVRRRLPRQPLPRGARLRRRRAERNPRTRTSRALKFRMIGDLGGATRRAPSTATSGTPGTSRPTRWKPATAATSAATG